MKSLELTELQMRCLGCALEHPEEPAVRHLLSRTGASTVDGVLAAIFVAQHHDRSILLALTRQVIAQHRPACEGSAERCID
jgi:hypothetical protein